MSVSSSDFVIDCVNDCYRLLFSNDVVDVYVIPLPNKSKCNRIMHIKRTNKLYYYRA